MRINVQLIDAEAGGNHVWAERFDRELSDIFAIQDEVTTRVIEAIVGSLSNRSEKQRPSNLEAYELCVRARHLWSHSAAACDESRILLARAIELDPNYAEAHWRYAFAENSSFMFYGSDRATAMTKALALAERALQIDPSDSGAHFMMGEALIYERRWDEAEVFIDRSLALNPNAADVLALLGDSYAMLGKLQEALLAKTKAMRLNPQPPGWYHWLHGFAKFTNGQYEEAAKTFRRPETYRTELRRNLAAALAKLDRPGRAREEAKFFMLANPNFRISTWIKNQPFMNPQDVLFWTETYRLAGLPE